jgi:CRISPR-associated exonuclease Cas4
MESAARAEVEVPISALEHFSYCPRQCALIHVEQTFEDNVFTVRGQIAHQRVDARVDTVAAGVPHVRGLALWSERWGLRGRADLVELRPESPFPVEYKVGEIHGHHAAIQLCAQALCLEEMLGQPVAAGALFSHASRRRFRVEFDAPLRTRTIEAIESVRRQLAHQEMPPAVDDARCPACSLVNVCLPSVVARPALIRGYQGAVFWPRSPREIEDDGDV